MDKALTQRFYSFRVGRGGKWKNIAVWNGKYNYKSLPPPELMEHLGGGKVHIAQVRNDDARVALKMIDELLPETDVIILWARNAKVYRALVDGLKATSTHTFEGLPKM